MKQPLRRVFKIQFSVAKNKKYTEKKHAYIYLSDRFIDYNDQ